MSDVYVSTTGNDSTGDGSIGNPYQTPQKGIDALKIQGPGNTLYFRSGIYTYLPEYASGQYATDIRSLNDATSWENSYTIRSYPGEWAIFDGSAYSDPDNISAFDGFGVDQKYIVISHLEIRNHIGTDNAAGLILGGGPFRLRFLYVHDNYCDASDGGNPGANNPAGIKFYKATGDTVVEFCAVVGNGGRVKNENCANIEFNSDYLYSWGGQSLYDANGVASARFGNIVRYCYIDGGGTATEKTGVGIKDKGPQFLANNSNGEAEPIDVNGWEDQGCHYHHNIIVGHLEFGVIAKNDFLQIYNNVIDQLDLVTGMIVGKDGESYRGPWIPAIYNNTVIDPYGAGIEVINDPDGVSEYYAVEYLYNNIISGARIYDAKTPVTFSRLWSLPPGNPTWDVSNRIHMENNYLYDCNADTTRAIVTNYSLDSVNAWNSSSDNDSHDASSPIFSGTTGASQYKLNSSYSEYSVLATGGRGGSHPYLDGVSIPAYRGAVNPNSDVWVDGVMTDLIDTAYLRDQESDPSWIEGAVPSTPTFYVDKGHPSASDSNPGTATLPWETITKASAEAIAGDTIYIKGGTYTNQYINPTNSGTADNPIVFKNYGSDVVTIQDASYGVQISGKSYIKVIGLNFYNLDHLLYISDGHHNEVSYCNFEQFRTYTWHGSRIYNSSTYNHLHDCTFSKWGDGHSGSLFDIGDEWVDTDQSYYNLIEDCEFSAGGHHVLGLYSRFCVVRNNYLHNEQWASGGYRCLITEGYAAEWNLIEGNRIAYGYEEGVGFTISAPNNIVRKNLFYQNDRGGVEISNQSPMPDADTNYIYHNTFYHNGNNLTEYYKYRAGLYVADWGDGDPLNNVIKNNIFYDNTSGTAIEFYGSESSYQIIVNNTANTVNPLFIDSTSPGPSDATLPDLALQPDSTAINAGVWLTTITSASGNGTVFVVADAQYFTDGWGIVSGDVIQFEGQTQQYTVLDINYNTNAITVDASAIWSNGDGVSLAYVGTAPDIGASEYSQVVLNPTGQVTSNPSPVPYADTEAIVLGTATPADGRTITLTTMPEGTGFVSGTDSWTATCTGLEVGINIYTVRAIDSESGSVDIPFSIVREAEIPSNITISLDTADQIVSYNTLSIEVSGTTENATDISFDAGDASWTAFSGDATSFSGTFVLNVGVNVLAITATSETSSATEYLTITRASSQSMISMGITIVGGSIQ